MKDIYYTLERFEDQFIVWLNVECHDKENGTGSFGLLRKFKGTRKECLNYCNKNNIKLRKRR